VGVAVGVGGGVEVGVCVRVWVGVWVCVGVGEWVGVGVSVGCSRIKNSPLLPKSPSSRNSTRYCPGGSPSFRVRLSRSRMPLGPWAFSPQAHWRVIHNSSLRYQRSSSEAVSGTCS